MTTTFVSPVRSTTGTGGSTAPGHALVVGLGIAGMATALRLHEIGWRVTVVERSLERRRGGYFIAIFGLGRASAERLGIAHLLTDRACPDGRTWEVSRGGRRSAGLGFKDMPTHPTLLLRGDVENALYTALPADVEVRFGTMPMTLAQDAGGVDVGLRTRTFDGESREATERFDLVVGADGIHSTVRRLTFGPDANMVRPLGYMIGATLLEEQLPGFAPGDGVVLAEPGRSMWTFAFADRAPGLLFSYRTDDPAAEFRKGPERAVREAFGPQPTGALLGGVIDAYARAEDRLFDEAAQVTMQQWYDGRVVVVGDAAWCMTLYSGLGASSGLAGADLLGTMLQRHDDLGAALAEWNGRLRPYVQRQQAGIGPMRTMFTPGNRREHARRTLMMRMMGSSAGRSLLDRVGAQGPAFADKELDLAAR